MKTTRSGALPGLDQLVPDQEHREDRSVYRDAIYAQVAGFRPMMLDLMVPRSGQPVPVVLYVHGGAFAVGNHKITRDALGAAVTAELTARGIAVASVGYRLSGEALFPAAVHDVKAAVRWLRLSGELFGIDPGRIGAWGGSAGGYFAAMLALTAGRPELDGELGVTGPDSSIRAAVSWFGPTHFGSQPRLGPASQPNDDPARSPESKFLGAAVETVPELAAAASPVSYVTADAAPMLLVHGTEDDGVPIAQSERLRDAYRRVGAPIELITVAGGNHGFSNVNRQPLLRASAEFLQRQLAP